MLATLLMGRGTRVAIDAMRLGAYDYITKPFDIDDIITLVGTQIGRPPEDRT